MSPIDGRTLELTRAAFLDGTCPASLLEHALKGRFERGDESVAQAAASRAFKVGGKLDGREKEQDLLELSERIAGHVREQSGLATTLHSLADRVRHRFGQFSPRERCLDAMSHAARCLHEDRRLASPGAEEALRAGLSAALTGLISGGTPLIEGRSAVSRARNQLANEFHMRETPRELISAFDSVTHALDRVPG